MGTALWTTSTASSDEYRIDHISPNWLVKRLTSSRDENDQSNHRLRSRLLRKNGPGSALDGGLTTNSVSTQASEQLPEEAAVLISFDQYLEVQANEEAEHVEEQIRNL